MRETRAVIFDMDGLLIDTEPVWRRVEREIFRSVGLNLTEEQCMETMGVRVAEVVALWYSRHPWEGPSREEITARILRGVTDYVRTEGEPQPGARTAIQAVYEAGLPIGIASSSSKELICAVVERLRLGRFVRAICSADDEQFGKPDPAVYVSAARALDVEPEACVALEDSPNGVLSAKAAGMYCIAVPDPHLAADPRMLRADLRLDSLEDFSLDLLPGLRDPV